MKKTKKPANDEVKKTYQSIKEKQKAKYLPQNSVFINEPQVNFY